MANPASSTAVQGQTTAGRWRFAAAAFVMQLCLGVLYAWSVFRNPLATLYGWSKAQTIAPYRYSLLFFTLGMIVAGFWQDRKGPRVVASAGGLLLALGCLLAAYLGDSVSGLILAYGVIGGLGVGFAYVTPIATCVKWFPDHRGAIAGFAVMGFGAGPLLFGPLLERLIGSEPALYATTIPRTFLTIAVIFGICVIGTAQIYRVPPAGWRPPGWTPPPASSARREEFHPGETLRSWQFWVLWLVYFLGASIGLTAIGEAAPFLTEAAKAGAFLSAGAALGVMSVFNGAGRLFWGALSDRLGRKGAAGLMFGLYIIACLLVLRGAAGFAAGLAGLSMIGFAYGGFLALMPSFTADYFGSKSLGANYGLLFTAWGLSGFFVPGLFAGLLDRARLAGATAAGYDRIFLILAMLAVAGAAATVTLRRPR
jgi:OFA family oxalate/formate antiporter-like MFS transporter